jgi:hypothetical protein
MKRIALSIAVAIGIPAAVVGLVASPASAHEARTVGAYHFLVGWGAEPAYAGYQNSVQLILTNASDGKPVASIGDSLKVEVSSGSAKATFPIVPTFDPDSGLGTVGDYRAWFIPTAPGNYTFHFTGKIGSQKIDQSFSSSETTFATVTDARTVEFPVKAPTNVELGQRIDQEVPRLTAAIATASGKADDTATGARTIGIVGLVVGLIGIAVGGTALARGRTRP